MLTRWRIKNFKSAYDATELSLRPITLFAGANSSAKSTFIQSILLVSQTLTSRVYSRPVVLNGHIARLGGFADLASANSEEQEISIGFTLRFPEPDLLRTSSRRHRFWYGAEDLLEVGCEIAFSPLDDSPSPELAQLQPRLTSGKLWATRKTPDRDQSIEFRRSKASAMDRALSLGLEPLSPDEVDALEYDVVSPGTLPERSGRYLPEVPADAQVVGVNLFHFLPNEFVVTFDATEHNAGLAVRYLTQAGFDAPSFARQPPVDRAYINEPLLRRVIALTEPFVEPAKDSGKRALTSARPKHRQIDDALQEATAKPTPELLFRLQRLIGSPALRACYESHFSELVDLARQGNPSRKVLASVPAAPEATHGLQFSFAQFFKYLGPLRDEPKPVYPMEGAVDPSDVGLRGEFTAAVLDLHKSRLVLTVPAAEFTAKGPRAEPAEMLLKDAVLDWLKYLGVVSRVQTTDKGVFGHELRVAPTEGGSLHNLVHVGVGVSQVLPIVVMSLMAEPGSVLVFEQPELHLHPRVQTLLADFMLSMAMLGKQCIVETHSEYLINRLRLRAAEDPSDKTQDMFALYFVEKEGPKSQYRLVDINEYGGMSSWPSGFFDEAPQEAERILRAAMEKRRARRGKSA